MPKSPEQNEIEFGEDIPEIVEVEVEPDEEKECIACGNLLASESKGCSECHDNKIKTDWQRKHPSKETHH